MDIKLLEGKISVSGYNASFLKNKDGEVISVSFPIESFLELTEDIEDYAYVEGREDMKDGGTVSHEEVLKEFDLTPEMIKEIRKKHGLTTDQLGKRIGYSGGTIRNIEAGQNKITTRFANAISSFK